MHIHFLMLSGERVDMFRLCSKKNKEESKRAVILLL